MASTPSLSVAHTTGSDQHQQNWCWQQVPVPIIAAGITVVGALVVAYCVHRWNAQREAVARFSAAAKDFRAAFAPELALLSSRAELSIGIDMYLFNAYEERQKTAITVFEGFLPAGQIAGFRTACHDYHSGQRSDGMPLDMFEMGASYRQALFVEYMGYPFAHPTMSSRQLAVHRIERLLSFAPHA